MQRKLAHRISNAAAEIGVGKSKFYEEVKAGRIRIVKIGRVSIVTDEELQRYLRELEREQAAA